MGGRRPWILFLDAYDSFSYNIVSLLQTTLDVDVHTLKIDDPAIDSSQKLTARIKNYDAIVCGPGPGHPRNECDVGAMKLIWELQHEDLVPVLGICLGFQSLCLAFGAEVNRMKGPQHGIVRRIAHVGESDPGTATSIFGGVGEINATLYQSLCADIGQHDIPESSWDSKKWEPTNRCPDLIPLAWVEHEPAEEASSNSGIADSRVFVGVRHRVKPFWALQYHPESICTNAESKKVIFNWFEAAVKWNSLHSRITSDRLFSLDLSRMSLLAQNQLREQQTNANRGPLEPKLTDDVLICHTVEMPLRDATEIPDIVELFQDSWNGYIILESSNAGTGEKAHPNVRGRYSIIGINTRSCERYEYTVGDSMMSVFKSDTPGVEPSVHYLRVHHPGSVWATLAGVLNNYEGVQGHENSPFWGGMVGYTTYELGLESIDVDLRSRDYHAPKRPDAGFVLVKESIVIDHEQNIIYFQKLGLRCDEQKVKAGLHLMAEKIAFGQDRHNKSEVPTTQSTTSRLISFPENLDYENKVRKCQEFIRDGNSYELCLTDQSTTEYQTSFGERSAWQLYKKLRRAQPAPFASYLSLGSATLVSASPERFLMWNQNGKCELRPMKGTIRKDSHTTFEQAKALLDVPKERAENLMIVDLVRHDLHGICGSGNVAVPKLMVVEEYQSVYQMISIVQGQIPPPIKQREGDLVDNEPRKVRNSRFTGIDVLAASLPPGSMTGAPKKRSCEILQVIEQGKERSMYSGVVGYMDFGGRGDFSVTIRCMFKWSDEDHENLDELGVKRKFEKWHVGAGGAVTTLSTPEGEREEMFTKARGTLGIF